MNEELLCPLATRVVQQLFTVFYALCNGFEKQYADANKLKMQQIQWIIAFMEEGITAWDQIERAVSHCRKVPGLVYTPQLGDFLSWCQGTKQQDFIPKEKAYLLAYELMRNELSESLNTDQVLILKHAIKASDPHFLKTNTRSATESVFNRNYDIAVRDFLRGELKPIPQAIETRSEHEGWETMRSYGILPQYAYLTLRNKAMPVIKELLKKNGGSLGKGLPYDKHRRG